MSMSVALRETRPAPGTREPDHMGGARRLHYSVLARVRVRHTFYNASGGVCPDFVVRPTWATAALLRSLGMLFKPEADGFTILYNDMQEAQLIAYLQRERDAYIARTGRYGAWTRLSFLMSLRTPSFLNFTHLPIDTNPALTNYFLTNQQAHVIDGGVVMLTPGTRVTRGEELPVTGDELVETVGEQVRMVELLDEGGEVAMCKPRCIPAALVGVMAPATITCAEVEKATGSLPPCPPGRRRAKTPPPVCSDHLFFDLSTLPEGEYRVRHVMCAGKPRMGKTWLYTSLYPMPLCYVNLLFSNPDGGTSGVYPVTLSDLAGVSAVEYVVRFTRRHTVWTYYVVPRDGGELRDLAITVDPESGGPEGLAFLGPCRVRLQGGGIAWRFISSKPIALQQRSSLRLRLHGRTERMTHVGPLLDPLPVAGTQQVLPLSPADACERARAELDPPDQGGACREAMDRLCPQGGSDPPFAGGRPATGDTPPPPCYSDIFVYV